MKFNFFSRPVVLDSLESETLRVALLDALKYTHDQREMLDVDSKEMPAIVNKVRSCIHKVKFLNICPI